MAEYVARMGGWIDAWSGETWTALCSYIPVIPRPDAGQYQGRSTYEINRPMSPVLPCTTTGASHASHLGCPSAYGSRVSYVKKRQVWKSRSETDWPHLGIMPGFSTEKKLQPSHANIHMLTDFSFKHRWTDYSTTPQKQKIRRFKRRFLPVFENSRGSIVCLRAANPVMCHDWAVLSLHTSPFQCDSQQSYVKTNRPIKAFTPVSSLRMILYYHRPMDSPSD